MIRFMNPSRSIIRRYWVPKDQIFYVRFLLEGYEGLCSQSSEPDSMVVEWEVPECQLHEADDLARALEREIGMKPIDPTEKRGNRAARAEDKP